MSMWRIPVVLVAFTSVVSSSCGSDSAAGGSAPTGGAAGSTGGADASTGGAPTGGTGGAAGADGGTQDAGAICADYASRICARYATCSSGMKASFGTSGGCEAYMSVECLSWWTAGVSGGPAAAATCVETTGCDELLYADGYAKCHPNGSAQTAEPCVVDAQCASGLCTSFDGLGCGVCGDRGGVGALCQVSPDCAHGLVCDQSTCKTEALLGQVCDASTVCSANMKCAGGTCVKGGKTGDTCSSDAPCDWHANASCVNGKCAQLKFVAVGQACAPEAAVSCQVGSYCLPTTKQCAPISGVGGPCGGFTVCAPSLQCLGNGLCGIGDSATCK